LNASSHENHPAAAQQARAESRILNEYFNFFNLTVIKGTRLTAQQFVPLGGGEKCTYLFKHLMAVFYSRARSSMCVRAINEISRRGGIN
jgi:hypothetical protein